MLVLPEQLAGVSKARAAKQTGDHFMSIAVASSISENLSSAPAQTPHRALRGEWHVRVCVRR